ncbi:SGNH/GDSL hydrolase family protein [Streptomyces sp. NPDC097619]|uniref:SGNH/GDSL hydrolase family protein n=1 Tax=Streptomyces sp. NPDC097619 TaxID=3157228 RepID=UPI00332B06CC
MGDSIADAESPALLAALKASGIEATSMAAAGGGGVVGEIGAGTWKDLPGKISAVRPEVIAYQITTYDWDTPEGQKRDYERLARAAEKAGARLLLISAPPFDADDAFYKSHKKEIESAPKAAKEVADAHPGKVTYLDASALWGTDRTAEKAYRSKDGIHSCRQGSAAFAQWFTKELSKVTPFTLAAPDTWANGPWTGDERYAKLGCS